MCTHPSFGMTLTQDIRKLFSHDAAHIFIPRQLPPRHPLAHTHVQSAAFSVPQFQHLATHSKHIEISWYVSMFLLILNFDRFSITPPPIYSVSQARVLLHLNGSAKVTKISYKIDILTTTCFVFTITCNYRNTVLLTSSLLSLFWEVDYTGTICSSPRVNENFNVIIISIWSRIPNFWIMVVATFWFVFLKQVFHVESKVYGRSYFLGNLGKF